MENVIEKSVQFRNNIRDISRRRRSPTEEDNSNKLLLEQCDDYRLQMKYIGVEIKVLFIILMIFFFTEKSILGSTSRRNMVIKKMMKKTFFSSGFFYTSKKKKSVNFK